MYSSQTLTYANRQLLDKFDSVEKQFKWLYNINFTYSTLPSYHVFITNYFCYFDKF